MPNYLCNIIKLNIYITLPYLTLPYLVAFQLLNVIKLKTKQNKNKNTLTECCK